LNRIQQESAFSYLLKSKFEAFDCPAQFEVALFQVCSFCSVFRSRLAAIYIFDPFLTPDLSHFSRTECTHVSLQRSDYQLPAC
jgi:hypothetical protein